MALNVLVVDDSAVMRKMIIRTLKMSGLDLGEIFEAGDGREGLARLDEHWIDLLLVDINMPVMDGMDMLKEIRSNREKCHLPVMVVSTESNEKRIKSFGRLGAEFVHKPFTPERLRDAVLQITGVIDEK